MLIEFNLAVIGEQNECPVQVIARARRTDKNLPITQLTTTKFENETDESYITNLSESIVIDMIKYVYEMQENDRRPQAWASRVAGDAATSNQGHP